MMDSNKQTGYVNVKLNMVFGRCDLQLFRCFCELLYQMVTWDPENIVKYLRCLCEIFANGAMGASSPLSTLLPAQEHLWSGLRIVLTLLTIVSSYRIFWLKYQFLEEVQCTWYTNQQKLPEPLKTCLRFSQLRHNYFFHLFGQIFIEGPSKKC